MSHGRLAPFWGIARAGCLTLLACNAPPVLGEDGASSRLSAPAPTIASDRGASADFVGTSSVDYFATEDQEEEPAAAAGPDGGAPPASNPCCHKGKKKKDLKKAVASAYQGVFYDNAFGYLRDPYYNDFHLGESIKQVDAMGVTVDVGGEYRIRFSSLALRVGVNTPTKSGTTLILLAGASGWCKYSDEVRHNLDSPRWRFGLV